MILVNLLGSPGAGKSTGAAYIFAKLKLAGVNAEYVQEFAKDKVWEESKAVFKNQAYIFGKQYFRLTRCADKVDVIVTDSPIILSAFYNNDPVLGEPFNKMVVNVFNSFKTMNYFINRAKAYNPAGRFQTESESDSLVKPMKDMLSLYGVAYIEFLGYDDMYDNIVTDILQELNNNNNDKEGK